MNSTAAPSRPGGYVLITPCRDEEAFAQFCIDSVLNQTVLPSLWILVNDGSSDGTSVILDELALKYSWVAVVHRADRGNRAVGPGVIDAFYAGLETITIEDFDYLCKFDLDIIIPTPYFEILIGRMAHNPRLGTCSGKAYFVKYDPPRLVGENCGDEMSVGMTKFYRVTCFQEIGGFVREVMWDGIDCHRCRMLGWIAKSWDEPDIQFIHLRPMGSSHTGLITGRKRHGSGQYFMGTSLLYITVSAFFRLFHSPYISGSLAILGGFLESFLKRKIRYKDLEFRRFLRCYQWNCLFYGKRNTTAKLDRRSRLRYDQPRKLKPLTPAA